MDAVIRPLNVSAERWPTSSSRLCLSTRADQKGSQWKMDRESLRCHPSGTRGYGTYLDCERRNQRASSSPETGHLMTRIRWESFKCTYNDAERTGFVHGGTCPSWQHHPQREDKPTALVLGLIKPVSAVLRRRMSGKKTRIVPATRARSLSIGDSGQVRIKRSPGRKTDSDETCAGGKSRTTVH